MSKNILLISIKPEYAEKIFSGHKTVELRRVRTRLKIGDIVLVYVSSPKKALIGSFEVENIIQEKIESKNDIENRWEEVQERACIAYEKFKEYYQGASFFVGIFFTNTKQFDKPIELESLRQKIPEFRPPQSYHYLKEKELEIFKLFM